MKNKSIIGSNLGAVPGKNPVSDRLLPAQQIPAVNYKGNYFHHLPKLAVVISKVKARIVVRGVKSALKEVEAIEKGIRKPKTLEQLLRAIE